MNEDQNRDLNEGLNKDLKKDPKKHLPEDLKKELEQVLNYLKSPTREWYNCGDEEIVDEILPDTDAIKNKYRHIQDRPKFTLKNFDATCWDQFWQEISSNPDITELGLFNVEFTRLLNVDTLGHTTAESWKAFCEGFTSNTTLSKLVLSRNDICNLDQIQWQLFCDACLARSTKTKLHIHYNKLGTISDRKWKTFCDMIEKSKNLIDLALEFNDFDVLIKNDWQIFSHALAQSKSIQYFVMNDNFLNPYVRKEYEGTYIKHWEEFCIGLSRNSSIKTICMDTLIESLEVGKTWEPFLKAIGDSPYIQRVIYRKALFIFPHITNRDTKEQKYRRELDETVNKKNKLRHGTLFAFAHCLQKIKLKENGLPIRTISSSLTSHILQFVEVQPLCNQVMKESNYERIKL